MAGTVDLRTPNSIRQAIKSAMLGVLPRSMLIASLPPGSGAIALTFDDGPHPMWTPRILDALAAAGAHATFFAIGERAARFPELIERISTEGHAVGHHSWTHSEPSVTSARVLLEETRRTRSLIEDITGRPAPLFRPPHGKLTAARLLGVWWQRNAIVLWNKDPRDYQLSDAESLVSWVTANRLEDGDILLLHDVYEHTATALPKILQGTRLLCDALRVS